MNYPSVCMPQSDIDIERLLGKTNETPSVIIFFSFIKLHDKKVVISTVILEMQAA